MAEPFRIGDLVRQDDVRPGDWVVAGVRNFEYDVGSLVPVGFEAYARVFHPAALDPEEAEPTEVRWAEIAAANGRRAHPLMQWGSITGGWEYFDGANQPGVWSRSAHWRDRCPCASRLSWPESSSATPARRTRAGSRAWEGSGGAAWPSQQGPMLPMPQRNMGLFAGPLTAVTTSFDQPPFEQLASLWWPDDRAWCVATDTDLMSTYVGGSLACVTDVVSSVELEAAQVSVDDKISFDSDLLNPALPPRGSSRRGRRWFGRRPVR